LVDLQDKCVNLLVEAGAKSLQGCERLLNGAPDHSGLVLAGPRAVIDAPTGHRGQCAGSNLVVVSALAACGSPIIPQWWAPARRQHDGKFDCAEAISAGRISGKLKTAMSQDASARRMEYPYLLYRESLQT